MNIKTISTRWTALLLALSMSVPTVMGAQVALRLGGQNWQYFRDNPNSYPTCKARMDFMHFDGIPGRDKKELFATNRAIIEVGNYVSTTGYDVGHVMDRIRHYEDRGWTVAALLLYREDWLHVTEDGKAGGPYSEDRRILSTQDINGIRNAIANSNFRCKHTVDLIQLLGGRVNTQSGKGGSWLTFSPSLKAHIRNNFDGVGTECHVGDHLNQPYPDGQDTLQAMAEMSKWAADNNRLAFVFMGGGNNTFSDLSLCQGTHWNLWSRMSAQGVDKKANHITYFRQGARDTGNASDYVPENNNSTLSRQMKWVINAVK